VNSLSLDRTKILVTLTGVLLVFAFAYHIWANWGLVTIHAKQQPLGRVIASMERQGNARIETDISSDTPVTMYFDKLPVADALQILSRVTDSRWRLLYFVAGDKSSLKTGEAAWFGGQRPDGWKMLSFPFGGVTMLVDDDAPVLDPRDDLWAPKTAAPAAIQDFFKEAAQATNASFAFPADWNPTVKSAPSSGKVIKVVPKLISAAGGHEEQLFFLSKSGRRGPRPDGGDGPTMAGDFRPDFDLMAIRVQGEIDRLPADQRSQAQANFDTERAFQQSVAKMSDEDRRRAWQQRMQDPQVQEQMAARMENRDSQTPHQQRLQHYQNYVSRKLTAMGKL